MKKNVVRVLVLGFVFVLALALIPTALAQTEAKVEISEAWWLAPNCANGNAVLILINVFAPAEYRLVDTFTTGVGSESKTGVHEFVNDTGQTMIWNNMPAGFLEVPAGGWGEARLDLYAPNGVAVSSAFIRADCTTFDGYISNSTSYDTVPLPAARVMGHVLADTPLYTEANPATVRSEVLKAGQTWFVVAQVTGTDGQPWYKVFVGGWNMAYVPASAMTLDGPVPQ